MSCNCTQSTSSCNGCGYYPSSLSQCLPCGPLQLETACGYFKLLAGPGVTAAVDYCNKSITLSALAKIVITPPVDSDGVDGEIRVDTSTTPDRLYVRVGGVWKYVDLNS
jgi:hypothetical protein